MRVRLTFVQNNNNNKKRIIIRRIFLLLSLIFVVTYQLIQNNEVTFKYKTTTTGSYSISWISSSSSSYSSSINNDHDHDHDDGDDKITRIIKTLESLSSIKNNNNNNDDDHSNNNNKYYIYENTNLTLPHIRQKAFDRNSIPTWGSQQWAKRFKEYAQGEIVWHQQLENHKRLRTYNITEAKFIIIPIPFGATIYWGTKHDMDIAMNQLIYMTTYFQLHPSKHVLISNFERLFRGDKRSLDHFIGSGITPNVLLALKPCTIVNDVDRPLWDYFLRRQHHIQQQQQQQHQHQHYHSTSSSNNDWVPISSYQAILKEADPNLFQHYWSIGYSHETAIFQPLDESTTEASYEVWSSKSINFFYHTTTLDSMYNSTIYRHALLLDEVNNNINTTTTSKLLHPSSIGTDISYTEWMMDFTNSKYCITIRGDNPSSRSFYRAIRVGCLPVVISNAMPYYHPIFRSLHLTYDDFAIVIDEESFLIDPAGSLYDAAINNISINEIKLKLRGLALLQRILILDYDNNNNSNHNVNNNLRSKINIINPNDPGNHNHTTTTTTTQNEYDEGGDDDDDDDSSSSSFSSLFVEAFVHETIASQQPSYRNFSSSSSFRYYY